MLGLRAVWLPRRDADILELGRYGEGVAGIRLTWTWGSETSTAQTNKVFLLLFVYKK